MPARLRIERWQGERAGISGGKLEPSDLRGAWSGGQCGQLGAGYGAWGASERETGSERPETVRDGG